MRENVITILEQVSADWLTAELRASGALTAGSVVDFAVEDGSGNWSTNARLAVRYSDDARGARPAALFLKMVDTDTGDGEYFLPAEVTVYTRDYVDVPDAPLLRCYSAAYDPARLRYHVLLDDVSATHSDARTVTPTLGYGLALAEGLAILHARWWGLPESAAHGWEPHSAAHIRRFVDIARSGVPHATAQFAADLKPHWPALIDEIFATLPDRLIERARDTRRLTVIHCDPNPGNILVPREGDRPLYLIDSQPFDWSLTRWLGAYDLAYAIGLYWSPETRAALEMPVLRHYHATLAQRGVTDYPWARFLDDYDLCLRLCVTVAVEYVRGGPSRWPDFVRMLLWNTLSAVEGKGQSEN